MTDINYSRFPTSAKSIFLTFLICMLRNDGYDRVESHCYKYVHFQAWLHDDIQQESFFWPCEWKIVTHGSSQIPSSKNSSAEDFEHVNLSRANLIV